MDEIELKQLVERYNRLLMAHDYQVQCRIRLVQYLHDQGMKYRDIYAIMEVDLSENAA